MPAEGGGGECVKVAIRCRPPSTKEIGNGELNIVEMIEAYTPEEAGTGQVTLTDPAGIEVPATFAFDIVFGLTIQQEQAYVSVGRPALMKTFEGYNGTIFAYGQTGSGKSWSMGGGPGELRGITPRMCEELFERIAEMQVGTKKFLVMCSYFEIYNEIIFDLLNPVADRSKLGGGLQVKEHPVLGIYVKDLTEIVSDTAQKLQDYLDSGMGNRAVASTLMNSTSSRSHSIFTIKVHQKDDDDPTRNVFAKLNLVDLAGSERSKGTGATGATLKEGANINKSLSALGNVINALVETANGKKVFIPYRNSKLTRVLQESLGGNSLCTMLATLSPAACNYEETMGTLRYANRAKSIKVSATKNEEASQISRLKAEVDELKKKLGGGGGGGGGGGMSAEEKEAEKQKFEAQLRQMEGMINNNWGDKAKLSEEHERQLKKIAADRQRAEQAVQEERNKRLRLLQDKNDVELTLRGLSEFVLHLPKFSAGNTPVLTGEQPRQWLKLYRSMRLLVDELKEQRTMVLVFKHALDEDLRLWGEGAEGNDLSIATTGLNRCLPKLDKFRKGGEKLLQLEGQGVATASELGDSVKQGIAELQRFHQAVADAAAAAESGTGDSAEKGTDGGLVAERSQISALEETSRLLTVVEQQVKQKTEELAQLPVLEMGPTVEIVLQSTKSSVEDACPDTEQVKQHCDALRALLSEPRLAALPPPLPQKPLREYTPADVCDTPDATEALLEQLIRWENLCGGKTRKPPQELLARPPPKFIMDVTIAVKASTGYPPSCPEDWPETRDQRIQCLTELSSQVSSTLGNCPIEFDPQDVLKGKEVPKSLRLLQLLAVAAAKSMPADAPKAEAMGVMRPRELPATLDAMTRCIEGSKVQLDAKRKTAQESKAAEQSAEHNLAEKHSALEQQVQEEARARSRQEEVVADAERQNQEAQAEMKRIVNEVELTKGAVQVDPEEVELQEQIDKLQRDVSAPSDLPEDDVLRLLRGQLDEATAEAAKHEEERLASEEQREELKRELDAVTKASKELEAEVIRERQRHETEQELQGQSPEEQKLILQAHQTKLEQRAESLDEQIASLEAEANERKAAVSKLDAEQKEKAQEVEEAQLQVQIVQEERDAMREAMEQMWNEKALVDQELHDRMQGYINLTERFAQMQDQGCELADLLESRRSEVESIQKNGCQIGEAF